MNPDGPCFLSGPRGCFSFEEKLPPTEKLKLLGVFSDFHEQITAFDASGRAWHVRDMQCSYKKTWWMSILAHTIYNPWVDVEYLWSEPKAYAFPYLRSLYLDALEADDDILTQFVEREELKTKITKANSFTELASIYRWAARDSG